MNVPLKRIIEYNSEDMRSVAKYYSGELVKFVKRTLSIIPTNIFDKLQEISAILTKKCEGNGNQDAQRDTQGGGLL